MGIIEGDSRSLAYSSHLLEFCGLANTCLSRPVSCMVAVQHGLLPGISLRPCFSREAIFLLKMKWWPDL